MRTVYTLVTTGPTAGDHDRQNFDSFDEMYDAFSNVAHTGKQWMFEIQPMEDFFYRLDPTSLIYRPAHLTPA